MDALSAVGPEAPLRVDVAEPSLVSWLDGNIKPCPGNAAHDFDYPLLHKLEAVLRKEGERIEELLLMLEGGANPSGLRFQKLVRERIRFFWEAHELRVQLGAVPADSLPKNYSEIPGEVVVRALGLDPMQTLTPKYPVGKWVLGLVKIVIPTAEIAEILNKRRAIVRYQGKTKVVTLRCWTASLIEHAHYWAEREL